MNQTLNMHPQAVATPTPAPAPAGSIFGTLTGYSPVMITSFEINATADHFTYYTSPVDEDGNYLLAGLSYGTYEIRYYTIGPGPGHDTVDGTVTIDATHPDVEHNIELMW